jgi:hypothetical protein
MTIELILAATASGDAKRWVVAVFNGFLVFTSAMGLNEGADKLPKTQEKLTSAERGSNS